MSVVGEDTHRKVGHGSACSEVVKRGEPSGQIMENIWWKRPSTLPLALMVVALLIIVVGGSIRVMDAGESCPDWPTCFGKATFVVSEVEQTEYWDANPDQIDSRGEDHRYSYLEIFSEWFHRLLVGIVSIPILLNALMMLKMKDKYRSGAFKAAVWAGVLLVLQAAAGAVTVIFDNVDWSVALHLALATIWTSSLMVQYFLMRQDEGAEWDSFTIPKEFIESQKARYDVIGGALFILMLLGAWVASTAGGHYNQGCSIGFPNGWPACHGKLWPSMDGAGVVVQMVHRLGALLAGVVLIISVMKIRAAAVANKVCSSMPRLAMIAVGLWTFNLFIGGSYIVFADSDGFPESLSLIHLATGVSAVLYAVAGSILLRMASIAHSKQDSEPVVSKVIDSEA